MAVLDWPRCRTPERFRDTAGLQRPLASIHRICVFLAGKGLNSAHFMPMTGPVPLILEGFVGVDVAVVAVVCNYWPRASRMSETRRKRPGSLGSPLTLGCNRNLRRRTENNPPAPNAGTEAEKRG